MQPTLIGAIVLLLGLAALFWTTPFLVRTALVLSLLGSAAAVVLSGLGGASILAGALFTVFVVLRMLLFPGGPGLILAALRPPSAGFWLAVATGYGVLAAFLIAPFFHGEILIYPIARSADAGATFALSPLQGTTGNITQSVYAIGQVLLFACIAAAMRRPMMPESALNGLILLGILHVLVSVLDIATFYSGTSFLIDWLRSATYITWQGASVGGLKRISGLFPEASMYAIYGLTICGIFLSLALSGYRRRTTLPIFYLSLLLLLLSTSTTAYVALAICAALILPPMLVRASCGRARLLRLVLGFAAALFGVGLTVVAVVPELLGQVTGMFDETLINKADSASGRDRGQLNAMAFQAFLQSGGLGLGLGSVRTSSFILTLLSNLGIVGTVAWLTFFVMTAFARTPTPATAHLVDTVMRAMVLRRAAQAGMIAGFIGASTSLHVFELGPLYYILAAFSLPVRQVSDAGNTSVETTLLAEVSDHAPSVR